MAFVSPYPVHPPYTLFELPLSWLWLPLCPLELFALAARPDQYTFCPPVITVIWEDYFPSCMFNVPPRSSSIYSPSSSLYHSIKQRSLAAGQRNEPEKEHATWKALSVSSQHSSERDVTSSSRKLGKSCCSPPHISET